MLTSCLLTSDLYQFVSLMPGDFFSLFIKEKLVGNIYIPEGYSEKTHFQGC